MALFFLAFLFFHLLVLFKVVFLLFFLFLFFFVLEFLQSLGNMSIFLSWEDHLGSLICAFDFEFGQVGQLRDAKFAGGFEGVVVMVGVLELQYFA